MRRNKNREETQQNWFAILGLVLLVVVLAGVVHLLYHAEFAETATPNDCFAAPASARATGRPPCPRSSA